MSITTGHQRKHEGNCPSPSLPCPTLQGTRHCESDRMARYGSSDEDDDEEATAEVVRCNDIHEMH